MGFVLGKSLGAASPDLGKPHPSRLFSQIYILFLTCFRNGPPEMHRRFRIGLPKRHIRYRIGPPESVLALLNPYWPS